MSETKANFRLRVARALGIVEEVTTTSAGDSGGTTFVSAEMADKQPLLTGNEWALDVTQGETRKIVGYQPTETMAVVNRAYTAQVANSTSMQLYKRFSPSDIDEALRLALKASYPYIASVVVDTSITMADDTYEVAIPSTITDLERMLGARVQVEVDTNVATYPYADMQRWTTREAAAAAGESYTLLIHPSEHISGRTVRLIGLGPITFPATEAATLPLPETALELLALMTISKLYGRTAGVPSGDLQHAGAMMAQYQGLYDQFKDAWAITLDPGNLLDTHSGVGFNLPFAFHAEPS